MFLEAEVEYSLSESSSSGEKNEDEMSGGRRDILDSGAMLLTRLRRAAANLYLPRENVGRRNGSSSIFDIAAVAVGSSEEVGGSIDVGGEDGLGAEGFEGAVLAKRERFRRRPGRESIVVLRIDVVPSPLDDLVTGAQDAKADVCPCVSNLGILASVYCVEKHTRGFPFPLRSLIVLRNTGGTYRWHSARNAAFKCFYKEISINN